MKVLKFGIPIIAGMILILWGVSLLMTSEYHVQRQIHIDATPEEIFPYINILENWNYWSPWIEQDPQMKITYEGPPSGIGAAQSWQSEKMGSGSLKINEVDENRSIHYQFTINGFNSTSSGVIQLEPDSNGTLVIWTDNGDLGPSPLSKYFKFMMNNMIGSDFDTGLKNLKAQVEKKKM